MTHDEHGEGPDLALTDEFYESLVSAPVPVSFTPVADEVEAWLSSQ